MVDSELGGIMVFCIRIIRMTFFVPLLFCMAGCSGVFHEVHYFATLDPETNKPVNYYRLTVSGTATATNARYISGFYDERAVDLFLNQTNNGQGTDSNNPRGEVRSLFDTTLCSSAATAADCTAARNKQLELVPIGAGQNTLQNGAFVLIMSSNADAIAKTIGSFAENDTVLNSGVFMLNRQQILENAKAQAIAPVTDALRDAKTAEIDTLLTRADVTSGAKTVREREALYLAAVQAIARGMDDNVALHDVNAARKWLEQSASSSHQ